MKILILSTVHHWNDPRIFYKQACTLAREHEVVHVAVGDGPERFVNGVRVQPLGTWNTRSDRPKLWWRAYREILRSNPDAIHFHDPELALLLLPFAFLSNKKIICDVHEHPSGCYGRRPWIPKILQWWIGGFFYLLLRSAPYIYDEVILAEDSYLSYFSRKKNIRVVRNYAIIPNPDIPYFDRYAEFDPHKELRLIYVGSIMVYRGALTMVKMVQKLVDKYPGVSLDLVGMAQPASLEPMLHEASLKSGGRIRLRGYIDMSEMEPLLRRAHIGLIPLKPDPNLIGSMATKFFDYMIYGLPCVASDFPLWQRFIEENPCGVNVDATDPDRLVEAIIDLVESPERLKELSRNGYRRVREKFSWEQEGEKLLSIYRDLST